MITGIFSEPEDSKNFIPSSVSKPAPSVDCASQKPRTSQDQAYLLVNKRPMTGDSHVYTMRSNDIASPDVFYLGDPSEVPRTLLRENSESESRNSASSPRPVAFSTILVRAPSNIDPKQSYRQEKLSTSPALSARASVPTSIPLKVVRTNVLDYRSLVNTEFNSFESLNTNTTSNQTPTSGSDRFVPNTFVFKKPMVLPRRQNDVSTSTNMTDEELDSSPVFRYTLSLSVHHLPSQGETSDDVGFEFPDFAKTVTWQLRVRQMEENMAAASISDAASVLADSFGDWVGEYLPSDSKAFPSDSNPTPTTFSPPEATIPSAPPECFASRELIQEGVTTDSDLNAHSDAISKPMGQSFDPRLVAPESEASGTSSNQTSTTTTTSSSQFFLPVGEPMSCLKTASKRKLDGGSMDIRGESVVCEASAEMTQPDVASNNIPPLESEPQDASQNRASALSSEYFIQVEKSVMGNAELDNREAIVLDAVEMDAWPTSPKKTLEISTSSQQERLSSVCGEKQTGSEETSSKESPTSEGPASQVEEDISNTANIPVPRPSPRNALGFRKGRRLVKSIANIGQQEESSSEAGLQMADGSDIRTGSQENSRRSQEATAAGNAEETTVQDSPVKTVPNFDDESSDASTVPCELESESPVARSAPISSPSKNDSTGAAKSTTTRSARAKEVLAEDTSQLHESPVIQPEDSTSPPEVRNAVVEHPHHQAKKNGSQRVSTPVDKLLSISRNAASTAPTDNYWKLAIKVYAKYSRRNYFYPGEIVKLLWDGRYEVMFEDRKTVTMADHNVILTELLPLESRVEVDVNGTGEFASGYVVSGHATDTTPSSYLIKRIGDDGDVNQVPRSRVAIHTKNLKELLSKGQVACISSSIGIFSLEVSGQANDDVSKNLPTSSRRSGHSSRLPISELPGWILVPTYTHRSRSFIDLDETTESGGPSSSVEKRTTAKKQVRRVASLSSSSSSSPKQQRRRGRKRGRKPSSGGLNRKNNQIMQAGRRIVTRASRTSRRLEKNQVSISPVSQPGLSAAKRRRREITTEESENSLMVVAPPSPPIIKCKIARRSSVARVSISFLGHSSMTNELDSETFKRLCRCYDVPIPQSDLFSGWAFVFTTGRQSAHSDNFRQLTSNDPTARSLLDLSENAYFLRELVATSGGRDIDELTMDISTTGCLENGRHVALIAPAPRRTVRYLQALATLGRVPLVHPVWIIDCCFLAAGKPPIVTPPEVVAKIVSMKIKAPRDLPLSLLRLAPRELYELPRGVERVTNQPVPSTIFPPIFTDSDPMFAPKTLFELGGCASSKIVAIVTNDAANFGEGWLSILRHFMLAKPSTELPSILSSEESLHGLRMLKATSILGQGAIVLVDQDRIPEATIIAIINMGFTVVNKEFLIQSLINGRMLDLNYATTWRN
ncbi:hypothetical protein Aperf_G00000081651 [Anoplocephala perfoliata]